MSVLRYALRCCHASERCCCCLFVPGFLQADSPHCSKRGRVPYSHVISADDVSKANGPMAPRPPFALSYVGLLLDDDLVKFAEQLTYCCICFDLSLRYSIDQLVKSYHVTLAQCLLAGIVCILPSSPHSIFITSNGNANPT